MDTRENDLVLIWTFGDSIQASVAMAQLQLIGIESSLQDENLINAMPGYSSLIGGVKLLVPKKDVGATTTFLKEKFQITNDPNQLVCPSCGSAELLSYGKFTRFIAAFFMGLKKSSKSNEYLCNSCGHEFARMHKNTLKS